LNPSNPARKPNDRNIKRIKWLGEGIFAIKRSARFQDQGGVLLLHKIFLHFNAKYALWQRRYRFRFSSVYRLVLSHIEAIRAETFSSGDLVSEILPLDLLSRAYEGNLGMCVISVSFNQR
jgi:hypothetical protein